MARNFMNGKQCYVGLYLAYYYSVSERKRDQIFFVISSIKLW